MMLLATAFLTSMITALASDPQQIAVGSQVTAESQLIDGGLYVIHQPRNNTCIEEGQDYRLMLNGLSYTALNGSTETTYIMKLLKNDDGTWKIQTPSGRYFPVATGNSSVYASETAGSYTLNFNSQGYAFPRTESNGVTYGLDRSSGGVYFYSTVNSSVGSAQCYQIYPVELTDWQEETIEEYTAYEIVNANGRGKMYYSPDDSQDFVWSTGKNDSHTDASNYQWVFVKTAAGDYNLYNIGRHAFIKPTSEMGTYSGYTWVFTHERVGITMTKLTSTTYSMHTTEGDIYLSASNGYTGPIISYYAASDQGVPFTLMKGQAVSDEVRSEIENGVTTLDGRDISVKQGYHTVGRNEDKALLLRISIPPIITATIQQLGITLKGKSSDYIQQLSIYQSDNPEFYADDAPRLLAQVSPVSGMLTIDLQDGYTLKSGSNYLYVTAGISDEAMLGATVDASLTTITYSHEGTQQTIDMPATAGDPKGEARIFDVKSIAYVPTSDNCRYYRIPAMMLDREGNIIVASDRRYDSNADLGNHKIDVSVRRSSDGGRTWSPQNIIAAGDGKTTTDYGYGDAALARTAGGRLICVMAAGSVMFWDGMRNAVICTSDDNGITWTKPRQLYTSNFSDAVNKRANQLGFYGNFISSGKGLTTFDGTVMFTNNCLPYDNKTSPQCYVISSTDEGEHWTMGPAKAYAGCDESKLEQLNDGRLLLTVRHTGDRGFNRGDADARKWDKPWRNSQISGNACNADILYYSRKTQGSHDILLHTYVKSSARENLTLAMSIDEGQTWVDFMNIQPGGAAYSTMVRLTDGSLAILYEDESYSVGNGYALTYVTITSEQITAFADQLVYQTSVAPPVSDLHTSPVAYYSLNGMRQQQMQTGVNIVRTEDGNVRKVIVR